MAQLSLALAMPSPVASPQRVLLPNPEDQARAEERLAVIAPALMYRNDPHRYGSIRLTDGTPVTSYTRMIRYVAETSGQSEKTIHLWIGRFQDGGLPALANKTRKDKNESRFFRKYPQAEMLAAFLRLTCKQSATVIYETIVRMREIVEVPEDDLPSYGTVNSWMNCIPPCLEIYAMKGAKAYREAVSPHLTGAYDELTNTVWIGDHALHDTECQNDCFSDAEFGAPIRIRISAFIDHRSRMVVGATWCWEGSSRAIAAAMRRGIAKYGPPEHLYVDNGRDYRKVAKGARPGYQKNSPLAPPDWWKEELASIEATGFLARLGIAVTHCLPHHPQSKNIERFFGTMHERFDRQWPTWTSGTPFTRPESTEVAMMKHRRLLKAGRVEESKHPKASEFIAAALAWIEEFNDTPHSGENMDGGSPRQVFESNLNPHQKPTPEPATLALLMAEHTTRTVDACAIRLGKRRYVPVDQAGWTTMHNLVKLEVVVAYDTADWENVAALDEDGHFLAWLQVEEKVRFAPWDAHTQAQIAESMATRRHLEKKTRETIQAIGIVARANGAQTPLQAMAKRLQLPASTDLTDVVTQRPHKFGSPDTHTSTAPETPAQAARTFLERRKA